MKILTLFTQKTLAAIFIAYSVKTNGKIDSEAATSLIMSKLFISAYELSKNSSVFITHYIEYNLSIKRQQAGNLGQAVEYAA